jgi:hypothetical protein
MKRFVLTILLTVICLTGAACPGGSGGGQAAYTDDGTVSLNEVMPNPFGIDADNQEWVELVNTGSAPRSLAGFRLEDGAGQILAHLDEATVEPGGHLMVFFGPELDDGQTPPPTHAIYVGRSEQSLPNDEGTLLLVRDGEVMDEVTWTSALTEGDSLGRDKRSTDTNSAQDWAPYGGADAVQPTLGRRNDAVFLDDAERLKLTQFWLNVALHEFGLRTVDARADVLESTVAGGETVQVVRHEFAVPSDADPAIFSGEGTLRTRGFHTPQGRVLEVDLEAEISDGERLLQVVRFWRWSEMDGQTRFWTENQAAWTQPDDEEPRIFYRQTAGQVDTSEDGEITLQATRTSESGTETYRRTERALASSLWAGESVTTQPMGADLHLTMDATFERDRLYGPVQETLYGLNTRMLPQARYDRYDILAQDELLYRLAQPLVNRLDQTGPREYKVAVGGQWIPQRDDLPPFVLHTTGNARQEVRGTYSLIIVELTHADGTRDSWYIDPPLDDLRTRTFNLWGPCWFVGELIVEEIILRAAGAAIDGIAEVLREKNPPKLKFGKQVRDCDSVAGWVDFYFTVTDDAGVYDGPGDTEVELKHDHIFRGTTLPDMVQAGEVTVEDQSLDVDASGVNATGRVKVINESSYDSPVWVRVQVRDTSGNTNSVRNRSIFGWIPARCPDEVLQSSRCQSECTKAETVCSGDFPQQECTSLCMDYLGTDPPAQDQDAYLACLGSGESCQDLSACIPADDATCVGVIQQAAQCDDDRASAAEEYCNFDDSRAVHIAQCHLSHPCGDPAVFGCFEEVL